MKKETIKEIKMRVHRSAGHGFSAFGHFYMNKSDEAKAKTDEFKKEIDSLIEYLDGLES